jgi:hypothetical protein
VESVICLCCPCLYPWTPFYQGDADSRNDIHMHMIPSSTICCRRLGWQLQPVLVVRGLNHRDVLFGVFVPRCGRRLRGGGRTYGLCRLWVKGHIGAVFL